jgi:hypothetical protein
VPPRDVKMRDQGVDTAVAAGDVATCAAGADTVTWSSLRGAFCFLC